MIKYILKSLDRKDKISVLILNLSHDRSSLLKNRRSRKQTQCKTTSPKDTISFSS